MRLLALVLVLALATFSFAVTRSECYSEVESQAATLHAHNAAQDPSGSIATKTYGCTATCTSQYDVCIAGVQDAARICQPDSGGTYSACFRKENQGWITCADEEINCCVTYEKGGCDMRYAADETPVSTATDPQKENACVQQYGGYAKYNPDSDDCYCPSDYSFFNSYISQCVHNGVYGYCSQRNAEYDEQTDSCVCKRGYAPSGDMCAASSSSATGGQSLGKVPDTGGASGTGSQSGGTGGCGSAAVLLAIGGAAVHS